MRTSGFMLGILLLSATLSLSQADSRSNDEAAIRAAALDYVESWYEGNPQRMQRALHPELAKRIAKKQPDAGQGKTVLEDMTAERLIATVATGQGKKTPKENQIKEVKILDVYKNAASVRAEMSGWVDYMHLAKIDGQWKIVNVLWELKPKE